MSINLNAFLNQERQQLSSKSVNELMLEGNVLSLEGEVLHSKIALLRERATTYTKLADYHQRHGDFGNLNEVIPVEKFIGSTESITDSFNAGKEYIKNGFSEAAKALGEWWKKFLKWLKDTWQKVKYALHIDKDPCAELKKKLAKAPDGSNFKVKVPQGMIPMRGQGIFKGDAVLEAVALHVKEIQETVIPKEIERQKKRMQGADAAEIDQIASDMQEENAACDIVNGLLSVITPVELVISKKALLELAYSYSKLSTRVDGLFKSLSEIRVAEFPVIQDPQLQNSNLESIYSKLQTICQGLLKLIAEYKSYLENFEAVE